MNPFEQKELERIKSERDILIAKLTDVKAGLESINRKQFIEYPKGGNIIMFTFDAAMIALDDTIHFINSITTAIDILANRNLKNSVDNLE
jgi:hypothetical protein